MRRRTVRRRSRRDERTAYAIAAGVAALLVVAAVKWVVDHWWVLVVVAVVGGGVGVLRLHQVRQRAQWERVRTRALRMRLEEIDALHHSEFETAVRDLLRRDGCKAVRLGGAGDDACDVRATDPDGRIWAVQCKHRRDGERGPAVGTGVLQQVNGTARQVHGADIAVVVTNGRFSSKAIPWGRQQHIHLVDRRLLAQWAAGARPLWELLDRLPPPRRPHALS